MSITERVFIVEPEDNIRRFAPSLCPSCPHFTGTSTCKLNVEKVYEDDKVIDVIAFRHLDRDNPYKTKSDCELIKPLIITDRRTLQGGDEPFQNTVLQYMKKNVRGTEELSLKSLSFQKVIHMITLFKSGQVKSLINNYEWVLTNSRNNPYYSVPFEYFTGIDLFRFSSVIGKIKEEKRALKYVRELCKYRNVLQRMVNAYIKYDDGKHFVSNFRTFFIELIFGMDIAEHLISDRATRYATVVNSWGYVGTMREALKEAGNFTEEEVPLLNWSNKPFKDLTDKEIKEIGKVHDKMKLDFANMAHKKFKSEVE